jgi:hypothetical protein
VITLGVQMLLFGVSPPCLPSNTNKSCPLLNDFPAHLTQQHSFSWRFSRYRTKETRLPNRKQGKQTQSIRSVHWVHHCQSKLRENQASGTWYLRTNFHFHFCWYLCVQNETLGNNATTFIKWENLFALHLFQNLLY